MHESHIILIGGGGHALVVAEALALLHLTIDGCFDDAPSPLVSRVSTPQSSIKCFPIKHLGPLSQMHTSPHPKVLCIGDLRARASVLASIATKSASAPLPPVWASAIIHPAAFVSPSATLAQGAFIGPQAVIHSFATIGAHAIINSGAIVEHECTIGANVHIAPGAALAGNVSVGPHTLIGLGARILPGRVIGANATIGAGAIVLRDVKDDETVVGVVS